jgi:uncharacterized protein
VAFLIQQVRNWGQTMRRVAIVGLLLSCVVACHDPQTPSMKRDRTAPDPQARLRSAIQDDDIEGVRSALASGASVRKPLYSEGVSPRTPLAEAVVRQEFAVARYLLAHGADPNEPDPRSGLPPIALSVYATSPALVELLLDAGAKPDPRLGSSEGMTPLAMASRVLRSAAIGSLVRRGADPNGWIQVTGPDGRPGERKTPLMLAAEAGNYPAILQLLEAGADPRRRNERGHSAADLVSDVAAQIRLALEHPEQYRPSR